MSRTEAWVFGSNLFRQLDPDDRTNPTKKIILPKNLYATRIWRHVTSFNILHVADWQTLVHFTIGSGESSYLEIWGFHEENQSTVRTRLDPTQQHLHMVHPVDQVKQWFGRTKIVGYLARDGTINAFNLHAKASNLKKSQENVKPLARYQAVTISDNGQVLAAVLSEFSQTLDVRTNRKNSNRLELWPSFQELLDFCRDSVQTSSNPKVINLCKSPLGETEIQLSSGASHFLILTHTPLPVGDQSEEEDSDYSSTLYAFGDNRFGQLGIGSRSVSASEPQQIESLPALSKIDCGLFHSLVVGQDGELYTFGHNRKGQCGVGSSHVDTTTPLLVDLGGNGEAGDIIDVIDARCGSEHTVVLTSSGVWMAGSNDLGQLGMENLAPHFGFQRNRNIPSVGIHSDTRSAWNVRTGRWNTFVWMN